MSSYYEEKYNEEQDRLNKDLEDAKSVEEKRSILLKYEKEYTYSINVLQKQKHHFKMDVEMYHINITKNDSDKHYQILKKYEEEQLKLLQLSNDLFYRVGKLISLSV